MKHIFEDYLSRFESALQKKDKGAALFQLHLMLQRDPMDQKEYVENSLFRFEAHFGISDEIKEIAQRKRQDFLAEGEHLSDEKLAQALGESLQLFEELASEEMLKLIKKIGGMMVARGLLKKAVYEFTENTQKQTRPHQPNTSAHNPEDSVTGFHLRKNFRQTVGGFLIRYGEFIQGQPNKKE